MSTLLLWATEEAPTVPAEKILSIKKRKKKDIIPDVHINEDIVIGEIDRGTYCPKCNMLTPGLPCGMDENCPW